MFDKDMQIHGKYATYWKALTQLPGNAVDTSNNTFKIFENYIYVYMRRQKGRRHARRAAQAGNAHELAASGCVHAQNRPRRAGQGCRDRRACRSD